MILPDGAKRIISLLLTYGYSAYAVGGCVRDAVMGRECGDVDITTSATPQQMETVLNSAGIRYIETGVKHGTITALLDGDAYEITTFRTDGTYADNRHPDSVAFVQRVDDDLARRDFTINAMAYNDDSGIIDIFGGMDDISAGLIRCVGDPDTRFGEDALRIMRALRFSAVLGFDIEQGTAAAIFRCKDLLLNVAAERLFLELNKLLLGDNAEDVLMTYRDVLAVIIPELEPMFDFGQHSRWHLYDVYTHTVKSLVAAPRVEHIRFALLLHDCGKPFTLTVDERGDHFKGHPAVSRRIAEDVLHRFKVSNDFFTKVTTLIDIHDGYIHANPPSIKRWLSRLGENMIYDFIDIKIADMASHNLSLAQDEMDELQQVRAMTADVIASGDPYRVSDLAVNGNDLIALGYIGHDIACELDSLLRQVISSPDLNTPDWLTAQAVRDKEKK